MMLNRRATFAKILPLVFLLGWAFAASAIAGPPMRPHVAGEVLIKFKKNTTTPQKDKVRGAMKGKKVKDWGRIKTELREIEGLTVDEAIERYSNHPDIEYVEPNYIVHALGTPNDASFSQLWGMENTGQSGGTPGADISATNAWDVFTGSDQVVIAVIDTGTDYNHPDLAANIWTNPGEIPGNNIDDDGNGFVDDVHGYDFVNNDGDPMDDHNHGTHVAGTIGAAGNNGTGVAGVNWNVKIMPIKFLSASGSGTTAAAIDAIEYATLMGVHLSNNSWGGGGFSQALYNAIADANANGILFVAAAGNNGANTDSSPHYPSNYQLENVISVAATDHNDRLASFSNYGPTTVDLAAPGVNVYSTLPNNTYGSFSGTSMAAPHVAGALGLVFGRFPSIGHLDARDLIYNFVDLIPALTSRTITGGRLNAFFPISDPDNTAPGQIDDLVVSESGSNWLTIGWTATGDDGEVGTASRYTIKYSTTPITAANFDAALDAPFVGLVGTVGTPETTTVSNLDFSTTYYFAAKARDEFGNSGVLSNVVSAPTLDTPDAEIAPPSLTETLLTGATSTQQLTLSNVAANSTLDFVLPTPTLVVGSASTAEYVEYDKDEDDPRTGDPVVAGSGGPDQFGYRWTDSDDSAGPAFNWQEISATGTVAISSGDDVNRGPFPIGFTFSHYGVDFTSFRVSSNGILSFTSASAAYSNQPLPTSSSPTNMIAPFWDDLVAGTGDVFYQSDGSRLIVQWNNMAHYGSGGPYTFQLILNASGTILFQYLSMGTPTTSATIGIQNATGTDGIQVAYNTSYVHDGLAVRMQTVPQWLSVGPESGTVVGPGSANFDVMFDATGLLGGTYEAVVRIQTNDPNAALIEVPTTLTVVGAPDISVSPLTYDFGEVFAGGSPTTTFVVDNPGTDVLTVSNISFTDGAYSVDTPTLTIPPRSSQTVTVTFNPTAVRLHPATMTVHSDDPDEPTVVITISGNSVAPPVAAVTPTTLNSDLFTGESETRSVTLSNSGGAALEWSINSELVSQTVTLTPPVLPQGLGIDGVAAQEDGFRTTAIQAELADLSGVNILWDLRHGQFSSVSWSILISDVTSRGATVSLNNSATITPGLLSGFDILWSGETTVPWLASEVSAIVGWVNAGGSLILEGDNTAAVTNFNVLLSALSSGIVFSQTDLNNGPTSVIHTHPSTENVSSMDFVTVTSSIASVVSPAQSLVEDSSGRFGVAVSRAGSGRIFAATGIAFYNGYIARADNQLFANQAIDWLAGSQFLGIDPPSGAVAPGASTTVTLNFDATGLFGGDYNSILHFVSNDPINPVLDVTANMHVTGAPDIDLDVGALDFGEVFVGYPGVLSVMVLNVGTDDLNVTSHSIDHSDYALDGTGAVPPFGLAPGETAELRVRFVPSTAGALAGTLFLNSDDSDEATVSVNLDGIGRIAPIAHVSPSVLNSDLLTGETEIQSVTVRNDGGSDLVWSTSQVAPTANFTLTAPVWVASESIEGVVVPEDDVRTDAIQAELADLTGINILWDRSRGQGPNSSWSTIVADLASRGATVTMNFLPITSAVLAGYQALWSIDTGTTWSAIEMAAIDAWVNQGGGLILEGDGSNTVPTFNALLTRLGAGIQYSSARATSGSSANLYPHTVTDGVTSIRLSGPLASLESVTAPAERILDDRLGRMAAAVSVVGSGHIFAVSDEIFYNSFLGTDDNQLFANQVVDWVVGGIPLTIDPASGVVPAGASSTVDVTFDATGLFGGDYNSIIQFASNDPANPTLDVNANLHVTGAPDIDVDPTALNFGFSFIGYPDIQSVTVANNGTDTLAVSNITFNDPAYSLDGAGATPPFTVPHSESVEMQVRFAPTQYGSVAAVLSIHSDDSDEGTVPVSLHGFGLHPPIASVTPSVLNSDLITGEQENLVVTLRNDGGAPLAWSASHIGVANVFTLTAPTLSEGADLEDAQPTSEGFRTSAIEAELADLTGIHVLWDQGHGQYGWQSWSTLIADLRSRGAVVTISSSTITPALLSTFDILWSGETRTSWLASEVSAINAYVGGGGGLILEGDDTLSVPNFNILLSALGSGIVFSQTDLNNGFTSNIHSHPTTLDVSAMDFVRVDASIETVTSPAEILVQDSSGRIGVAAGQVGSGRVFAAAGISFYNGYIGRQNNQLFANQAIDWLAGGQFLGLSPTSGVVPVGGSTPVTVAFDATGLFGGDYNSDILFETTDPANPTLNVRANLHVTGAPDIDVSPGNLAFGMVFVGYPEVRQITVSNMGTGDLNVSNISFDNTQFMLDPSGLLPPFVVPHSQETQLDVHFDPVGSGLSLGSLFIHSDDADQGSVRVTLHGAGLHPPIVGVSPGVLNSDILIDEIDTQQLTVRNDGVARLNWSVTQSIATQAYTLTSPELPVEPDDEGNPPSVGGFRTSAIEAELADLTGVHILWERSNGQHAASGWSTILADATVRGATVTESFATLTPELLAGYQVLWSTDTSSAWSALELAALDDWVRGGGGVILEGDGNATVSSFNTLLGVLGAGIQYSTTNSSSGASINVHDHETTDAVSAIQLSGPLASIASVSGPAERVFDDRIGRMTGAAAEVGSGRVFAVSDEIFYNSILGSADNQLFGNQIVDWVANGSRTLTIDPSSGYVVGGSSQDLIVTFNATGLLGGDHNSIIHLTSNDPETPVVNVPANLHVTGIPDIAVDPPSLDFGDVYIGYPETLGLTVRNTGTDVLIVSAITAGLPGYSVDMPVFEIPALQSREIVVSLDPTTDGSRNTLLTIVSNDPDTPNQSVALAGVGVVPPVIEVAPSPIVGAAIPGFAKQKTLTVCNTGGSDLDFDLVSSENHGGMASSNTIVEFAKVVNGDTVEVPEDPRQGVLGTGGPDMFGYSWRDSDEQGGPTYDWVDITSVGTPVGFSGSLDDRSIGPIPIGFAFPFYGNAFSELNVTTNGWLSFTSTWAVYYNQPLPNGGSVPENLLAVWWDDMAFSQSLGNEILYYNDGSRFIVEFFVRRLGDSSPPHYRFQVILYPNGDIVYQYHTLDSVVTSATIGIQNQTRDDGLMVAFNSAYVHEGLAIRFSAGPSWLTVTPTSGALAPDECTNLDVVMDAAELEANDYYGDIMFSSNDPATPVLDVDAVFHVGTIEMEAELKPTTIDIRSDGQWFTAQVNFPQPFNPDDVVYDTVLLNMAVAPHDMVVQNFSNGTSQLIVKFRRSDVIAVLESGLAVDIVITGEIRDTVWFVATGQIRALLVPWIKHSLYGVMLDTDGDGVADDFETGTGKFIWREDLGTDPLNPDTDGDGMSDYDELQAGSDPTVYGTEVVQVPSLDGTGLGIMVSLLLGSGLAMRRRGQRRNSRFV